MFDGRLNYKKRQHSTGMLLFHFKCESTQQTQAPQNNIIENCDQNVVHCYRRIILRHKKSVHDDLCIIKIKKPRC